MVHVDDSRFAPGSHDKSGKPSGEEVTAEVEETTRPVVEVLEEAVDTDEDTIVQEMKSAVIETLEGAPEEEIRKPTSGELKQIREDIALGIVDDDLLIRLIKAGHLTVNTEILNLLIKRIPHIRKAAGIIFKNAFFLHEDQQIELFKQLDRNAEVRDIWFSGFFTEGKLNPIIPAIHDGLLKTEYGLNVLISLAHDFNYHPSKSQALEFERKLLSAGRYGFEVFNKLATRTRAPFTLPDEIWPEFDHKNEIYSDADVIFRFIHEDTDYKENITTHLQEIDEGTQDTSNPVVQSLERLLERDEFGYILLQKNIDELSSDFIQAIIEENYIEGTDTEDRKIRAYMGKTLGRGGIGRVFTTAYSVDESEELQYQAIKVPFVQNKDFFKFERDGALLTQEWDHPHINKPLHISDAFIIYETGPNAINLSDAIGRLSPRESMRFLIQAMKGALEYQRRGYIHGDVKGTNILVVDIHEGKRAMLIDNSPVKASSEMFRTDEKGGPRPNWPTTKNYSAEGAHLSHIAEDSERRFYGIDNFSFYYTYYLDFLAVVKDQLTDEQLGAIHSLYNNEFWDPERISEPDALQNLIQKLEETLHVLPDEAPPPTETLVTPAS